jgi:large subunit ribosomal protein L2|uniref:Ribosomal protein L2 n=1 Tax=Phaeodactylum tricornutum TaxID=2850 RepID=F1DGP6_PHATR|nr:ribosomal protein L2 [Phaeodactylum tricornutum]ADY18524.1 ribosomal protein L2 [Phaeodactylum tricornutum]
MKKITSNEPIKMLQQHLAKIHEKRPLLKKGLTGIQKSTGRNNSGKITIRHKGGGHKKRYRTINFLRTQNSEGIVCTIEYDPCRNANIASIYDFEEGKFYYILAPEKLSIGDVVKSGRKAEPKIGHSLPISKIPVGSYIHNIAPKKEKKAQISRAAGTFSRLTEKTLNYAKIELSSGKQRFLSAKCLATIGIVSNELSFLFPLKKAGQSRWLNKRPSVRGVAMNPVDHPHGGGEGKKSGKGKTLWGKSTKNGKIRKKFLVKKNPND